MSIFVDSESEAEAGAIADNGDLFLEENGEKKSCK
jgi:hypothetical protein